jgi:hypothetical protein
VGPEASWVVLVVTHCVGSYMAKSKTGLSSLAMKVDVNGSTSRTPAK